MSYSSNVNIDVLPTNFATFGVKVKWEPFDWGRNAREVASKRHAVEQARLALRDAEDRTVMEINTRYRTLAEKRALLKVAQMAQGAAREKLRVKRTCSRCTAPCCLTCCKLRADLANADDQYQQALVAFWTAKADYDLALGEEVLR